MPDWPVLLTQAQACRFLSCTRARFDALVRSGLLPSPANTTYANRAGIGELERCLDRLYQLEDAHCDEQERPNVCRALDAYEPPSTSSGPRD